MMRWLIRLLFAAVVLIALFALLAQIVFWSDWPREYIRGTIESETGLLVKMEGFSTGWTGHTVVSQLELIIPGHDRPIMIIDVATLSHTSTLGLIFGSEFELDSLTIEGATANLHRDEDETWNIQQLLRIVLASGDDDSSGTSIKALDLQISDLVLQLSDSEGRSTTINRLALTGKPTGPASVTWTLTQADDTWADGTVVMRGQWPHHVNLKLQQPGQVMHDWIEHVIPGPLAGQLIWKGYSTQDGLTGQLVFADAVAGIYHTQGKLNVSLRDDTVTIKPLNVLLAIQQEQKDAQQAPAQFHIDQGEIHIESQTLTASRLLIKSAFAQAGINGRYDWRTESGQFTADFLSAQDGEVLQRSTLEGQLQTAATGQRDIDLTITNEMQLPPFNWRLKGHLAASGVDFKHLKWNTRIEEGDLTWRRGKTSEENRRFSLAGLQASGHLNWPLLRLDELDYTRYGQVSARGQFDFNEQKWKISMVGRAMDPEDLAFAVGNFDLDLDASGTADEVQLHEASFKSTPLDVIAHGKLVRDEETGWMINMTAIGCTSTPGIVRPPMSRTNEEFMHREAVQSRAEELASAGLPDSSAAGLVPGEAVRETTAADAGADNADSWACMIAFSSELTGPLEPMDVHAKLKVRTDHMVIQGQAIKPLALDAQANFLPDRITMSAQQFDTLGGRMIVRGEYAFEDQLLKTFIDAQELALQTVGILLHGDLQLAGEVSGELEARIPVDRPREAQVSGTWNARDLKYGDFAAETMEGKLRTVQRGLLLLDQVTLTHKQGQADGRMLLDLREGARTRLKLNARNWPVQLPAYQVNASINGDTTARLNLLTGRMSGNYNVQADIELRNHPVSTLDAHGSWDEKMVRIKLNESSLLGGTCSGEVTLDLTNWLKSQGQIDIRQIQPSAIQPWWGEAEHFRGAMNGQLVLGPATEKRALEPLLLTIALHESEDAGMSYLNIGSESIEGKLYIGESRIVMNELVAQLAGGQARVWFSLQQREAGWYDHLQVNMQNIQLQPFVMAMNPGKEIDPVPGMISGQINTYGKFGDWKQHDGQGRVQLTESNLVNTDIFGKVLESLGFLNNEAEGAGLADFRMQSGTLYVDRFIYRNGASEVLLDGRVDDISLGMKSPIRGQALGSYRPFANVDIEALDDIDRLFRAFQANVSAVTITGTLDNSNVESTSTENVTGEIRRLLQ